jgi:transcriptional regulator with XRE-family HTH domain
MARERMRFGQFLRKKRLDDPRELRQADIAEILGLSLSYYTDIENDNRRPLNGDEIEIVSDYLNLSEDDKAKLYNFAAFEKGKIPADLEETVIYEKVGEYALMALRESKAGNITEEMWKQFIRSKKEKQQEGENDD